MSSEGPALTAVPPGSQVLIVGDACAIDKEAQCWASVLSSMMGWDARIDGMKGAGFFTGGSGTDRMDPNTYFQRILRLALEKSYQPSLVIVQGSQSDHKASPDELVTALEAAVDSVRVWWPDAQVVVLGTMVPEPNGSSVRFMNETLRSGSASLGIPFVDSQGWLTAENSPGYASPDGWDLNTAGHAVLASKIKEALDARTDASRS